jgi:hypothetical protein
VKEREPLVFGGLVALLLVLWLGFLLHDDPRFAGSFWGGVLGVAGGLLMLASLAYLVVKRIPPLKRWVTARVPMRTLLAWHMYMGILGAILGVLHTGHKFVSPLGVALTGTAIVVTVSGFVGRHLMKQVSLEVREKKELLTNLELAYRETAGEVAAHPEQLAMLRPVAGFWSRLSAGALVTAPGAGHSSAPSAVRAIQLADAIADVEYAIKTHEAFNRWFAAWLTFHIVTGFTLYVLLALHVWSGIHFGLRWFQ